MNNYERAQELLTAEAARHYTRRTFKLNNGLVQYVVWEYKDNSHIPYLVNLIRQMAEGGKVEITYG